jgi:phosphoglycolate phosphatase-like HAD superfamily hydrolase
MVLKNLIPGWIPMLIFDFDGVLINSLDEIVLTTYNATTDSLITSMAEIPADLVRMFKNNRFHVQPIGDAIALMDWCLRNKKKDPQKILTPEEFLAIAGDFNMELTDRTNLIYGMRQRFITKDIAHWFALHHTYQPLWDELIQRNKYPFAILTNKNQDATLRLCRHFGLNIDTGDIYSGDNGVTKIENMLRIQERFGQQPFFFIDDSIKNLVELDHHFNRNKKVLSLAWAAWGYVGTEDAGMALESGYPALQQIDVVRLLESPN